MPGYLLHVGARASCQHQSGQISMTNENSKVFVSNQAVVTSKDKFTVGGCPFQVPTPAGPKPQPCVTVELVPATKVSVGGSPVILVSQGPTEGVCQTVEQLIQGQPIVNQVQNGVRGI
jgi:hypothetical protein